MFLRSPRLIRQGSKTYWGDLARGGGDHRDPSAQRRLHLDQLTRTQAATRYAAQRVSNSTYSVVGAVVVEEEEDDEEEEGGEEDYFKPRLVFSSVSMR